MIRALIQLFVKAVHEIDFDSIDPITEVIDCFEAATGFKEDENFVLELVILEMSKYNWS